MLSRTFQVNVNCKIQEDLVCFGNFDGENEPALAIGTSGNRVLLHNPKTVSQGSQERYLNINREISALASGKVELGKNKDDSEKRDALLVGSPSSLLVYDVLNNCDVFFKDVQEGVRTIHFGKLEQIDEKPLIFVGGNCSLQGFDFEGNESFWTVIGGNAESLCFCDANRDGTPELLVGSDDFEIRVFQNEQSIFEITETESIRKLCSMGSSPSRFAYGLQNGTIGIYDGSTRVWRVKSKDTIQSLVSYDLDGDGVDEIISGWSNGRLEARRDEDGEVVYRENLTGTVASLLKADFRGTGNEELICCTMDGEICGYDPATSNNSDNNNALFQLGGAAGGVVANGGFGFDEGDGMMNDIQARKDNQDVLNALFRGQNDDDDVETKQHQNSEWKKKSIGNNDDDDDDDDDDDLPDLVEMDEPVNQQKGFQEQRNSKVTELQDDLTMKMMELQSLEENLQKAKSGMLQKSVGEIPDDTKVSLSLEPNLKTKCIELIIETNNDCLVHNALVFSFDSGVFDSECLISENFKTTNTSNKLIVELRTLKHVQANLTIKSFISARGSSEYLHVFEDEIELAPFAMFAHVPTCKLNPDEEIGTVSFKLDNIALEDVSASIEKLFGADIGHRGQIVGEFVHLIKDSRLLISVREQQQQQQLVVRIQCDDMEATGQIIQELCAILGVKNLETCVDFPKELRHLESLVDNVQELNSIRQRLNAEMADESHYIKSLVVKGEDARLLQDVTNIRQTYQELTTLNSQLIGEYNKRTNNQKVLLETLREVNQIIQFGAKMRVGKPQLSVVAACRQAIKTYNKPALFHALTSQTINSSSK